MDTRAIALWDQNESVSQAPSITPFLLESDRALGMVAVFPGGGYSQLAPHEAEPVARCFNDLGFHACVVRYRVHPNLHPAPLQDASRALRRIREMASIWKVDAHHIAALGFSAGGHLVASLGVYHGSPWVQEKERLASIDNRPDGMILCYPVISIQSYPAAGSARALLGDSPAAGVAEALSLEKHVTASTPPAFIFHCGEDDGVPIDNSMLFAEALREKHIPFELHLFHKRGHGVGLAQDDPHVGSWPALCALWLQERGWPRQSNH